MKFPPPFSAVVQPIGFKTFLQVLWSNLDASLFSLKNIVLMKFGSLYKIRTIEKNTFFDSTFCILLLLSHRNDTFWKKKDIFQFDPSSHGKNCSSERRSKKFCGGGELVPIFWPLSSLYLPEESILEFRVYDNLCSTPLRSICPASFEVLRRAVLEKPRKVGGPLNQNIWCNKNNDK